MDWHFLTGTPFLARVIAGFFIPKYRVLGTQVAGVVEAVGEDVTTAFSPALALVGF